MPKLKNVMPVCVNVSNESNSPTATFTITKEKNLKNRPQENSILFFPRKYLALEFQKEHGKENLHLYSVDVNSNGAKKFTVITYRGIFNYVFGSYTKSAYENIQGDQLVKFHIDIDLTSEEPNTDIRNRLLRKVIAETIQIANQELEKYGISEPEIIVLKSQNNKQKLSAHIIYRNVIFQNIYYMKIFFMTLKSELIDKKIIDKNIYRVGCFRLLNCCKKGKNNKLVFEQGINYEKPSSMETLFLDTLITNIPKEHLMVKIDMENVVKKIRRRAKIKNDKTNSYESNYIYILDDSDIEKIIKFIDNFPKIYNQDYCHWILATYAFIDLYQNCHERYQKKIYELWDSWCQKGSHYDKDKNENIFNTLSLDYIDANYIPILANSKFRFKKIIKYDYLRPQFTKLKFERYSESFINENLVDKFKENDILFIKSPTGTGKTTLIHKILDQWKDKKILSISSRKSLAQKHSEDFKFELYNRVENFAGVRRLSIVLNSLLKIYEDEFKGSLVILDELSKLLAYIKSSLFDGIRYDIFSLFVSVLQNAQKIIVLDADLTDIDVQTILNIHSMGRSDKNKKIVSNTKFHLYINEHKNRNGIKAFMYDNPNIMVEKLLHDFTNNIPFIACFDSLTKMKDVLYEVKKRLINHKNIDGFLKIYSSEHGSDNIDTTDWELSFVFFSPVIVYAIDHSSKIPTKVYAFGFNKILTPFDINQQIQRCRNQSEIHVFVNNKYNYVPHNSKEDFEKDLFIRTTKYSEFIKGSLGVNKDVNDEDYKEISRVKKLYHDLFVETTFREQVTKSFMPFYLENILKDMGYDIIKIYDKTKFKLSSHIDEDKKFRLESLDKIVGNKEIKDIKLKETFLKRIEMLNIDINREITDFERTLIVDKNKYMHHRQLIHLLCDNINEKILYQDGHDFDESMIDNFYLKLKYYKQVTNVLEIPFNLIFNYDDDHARFRKKIEDRELSRNIDEIKKVFRITGIKYINLDKECGYERLYKMAVTMCCQLFGDDIIKVNKKTIRINNKKTDIRKYYTDFIKLRWNIDTFRLSDRNKINDKLSEFLKMDTYMFIN